MKSRKNPTRHSNRITGLFLLILFPLLINGKNKEKPPVSPFAISRAQIEAGLSMDSILRLRLQEINFIADQIENTYISGRRGLSDREWEKRLAIARESVMQTAVRSHAVYLYNWCYLGLLIQDHHFDFPDGGMFNRYGIFRKSDELLPLWVQTWKDGTVYNVKDYTGVIPPHARILSVNNRDAQESALRNRTMFPGEEAHAMAWMNAEDESVPQHWSNFSNFFWIRNCRPPFEVVYTAPGSDRPDTVVLKGMTRDAKSKEFKKSGDKRRMRAGIGSHRRPVEYRNMQDGIGVLTINLMWGKRYTPLILFSRDWRYPRMLRRAMRRIDRDGIKNLIVDLSICPGGMGENVYKTLDYFTDRPVDRTEIYRVTDNNRKIIQALLSHDFLLSKDERRRLSDWIGQQNSGTLFRTDTLFPMQYRPRPRKHGYRGNVYVLTSHLTYSAAQILTQYFQHLGIGRVAGQHCGGFMDVTSGNAPGIPLPLSSMMPFNVPVGKMALFTDRENSYRYPPVDIPIDHPFEEWLNRENRSVDRLIDMIRSGTVQKHISSSDSGL